MQVARRSQAPIRLITRVYQIAIDVVLQDELRRVKPVIEYLATHDMPTDSPAVLVALVLEPVMPKKLSIEVVRLVRRVVDMVLGTLEDEEAMVVDQFFSTI